MKRKRLLALSLASLAAISIMTVAIVGHELAPRTKVHVISKWEAIKIALERNFTLTENATIASTLELWRFFKVQDSGGSATVYTLEVDSYTGFPKQDLFYPPVVAPLQELRIW